MSNLSLLATFKYFGFFAESFAEAARTIGFEVNAPMMNIVLPIGISFYTFQTLSYTIDVWRGDMKPSRSIVNFAAYVCFFPQLVAGPIERAKALLPQFEARRVFNDRQAFDGALLFLWGLYKKTVIADNLAPVVNAAVTANKYTLFSDAPPGPSEVRATGLRWDAFDGNTALFPEVTCIYGPGDADRSLEITPQPASYGWGLLRQSPTAVTENLSAFAATGRLNFQISTT